MLSAKSLELYQERLKSKSLPLPDFHVVLGSGFGEALNSISSQWSLKDEIPFTEIPGLVGSTVKDHKGAYRIYQNSKNNKTIQVQMGRIHGYEGHSAKTVVQPVMLPRLCGVKNFILTNAAGGLLKSQVPGGAMIIQDHVNLTGQNPLIGPNPVHFNGTELGPRFPDMGNCYLPDWSKALKAELIKNQVQVTEGIYLGLLGPSFETHAEVRLFANWGMGAVGMSTVWESIALKHSGANLAGISLISNLGAGLSNTPLDHESIVETCRHSASKILAAILNFIVSTWS